MKSRSNPTLKSSKIKVGITIGDPSGIGPAITLKAIQALKGLADFTVIGDNWVLKQASGARQRIPGVKFIDLDNVSHQNFSFGKIRAAYGRAAIEYLDKALKLIKNKQLDCMVTAPISKQAINQAGFKYAGHTEYLSAHTYSKDTLMLLLNKKLKFSLVTRHIPLGCVSSKLSQDAVYKTILLTNQCLKSLFLIKKPRIVICGLNPHASDNGLIGEEENKIIKPALNKIRAKFKFDVSGPVSSDAAIYKLSTGKYDCAIAMYHDQALIPLKLTGQESGVNLTFGLPFIRTSPLHGTAHDIAKTPSLACPHSFIEAIKLAIKCATNLKRN